MLERHGTKMNKLHAIKIIGTAFCTKKMMVLGVIQTLLLVRKIITHYKISYEYHRNKDNKEIVTASKTVPSAANITISVIPAPVSAV